MECVQAQCDTHFAQISCHTIRVALSWHRLHVIQLLFKSGVTCNLCKLERKTRRHVNWTCACGFSSSQSNAPMCMHSFCKIVAM